MIPGPVLHMLQRLRASTDVDAARARLAPRLEPRPRPWRTSSRVDGDRLDAHWEALTAATPAGPSECAALSGDPATYAPQTYAANIESFIGAATMPVGIAGPLRVNGLNASGDFLVPLATTEAALVASYSRGAEAITRSGGASAALLYEGVLRTPAFVFRDVVEAGVFVDWIVRTADDLRLAAEATTRHGRLVSIEPMIETDIVFLMCRFTTGDAAGQNMATIAADALCNHAAAHSPVPPLRWFLEGNFSGDKKASHLGLMTGRGRKVSASVILPGEVLARVLGTDAQTMLAYARVAELGAKLSGQIGAQGHYANGLAALYIATGQDAACVSESATGITRMEPRGDGLFMSVTLPNLLVGTVGGGTGLPTQRACLRILGLEGPGSAAALAEVAGALCLAGEISIMAALASGHFARAHRKLARDRANRDKPAEEPNP